MEQNTSNAMVAISAHAMAAKNDRHQDDDSNNKMITIKDDRHRLQQQQEEVYSPKQLKKRGPMHVFRVALFMLRRKPSAKSKAAASMHVDLASMVLGSMRPLHLPSNDGNSNGNYNNQGQQRSSSKEIETHEAPLPMVEEPVTITEDVFTPPASPAATRSIASSSSMDSLSQYASATNLHELDVEDDDDDVDECYDVSRGDEMIDAKAEEFINQFYQQMKIQNFEYMNRQKQMKMKEAEM